MTYEEKLNLPQWKDKRKKILERDKNKCVKCGYQRFNNPLFCLKLKDFIEQYNIQILDIIDNQVHYKIIEEELGFLKYKLIENFPLSKNWDSWNTKLEVFINKDTEFKNFDNLYVAYFPIYCYERIYQSNFESFEEAKKIQNSDDILKKNYQIEFEDNFYNLKFKKDSKTLSYYNTDTAIIFNKNKKPEWLNMDGKHELHVHHKLYIQDKMPWEYEDKDLVTLCNLCHKETHENESIPYYDKYGRFLNNLEVCDRCDGHGFILEYKHVMKGICFKCWGEGFDPIKSNFKN